VLRWPHPAKTGSPIVIDGADFAGSRTRKSSIIDGYGIGLNVNFLTAVDEALARSQGLCAVFGHNSAGALFPSSAWHQTPTAADNVIFHAEIPFIEDEKIERENIAGARYFLSFARSPSRSLLSTIRLRFDGNNDEPFAEPLEPAGRLYN